jgi:hypothetical protein
MDGDFRLLKFVLEDVELKNTSLHWWHLSNDVCEPGETLVPK